MVKQSANDKEQANEQENIEHDDNDVQTANGEPNDEAAAKASEKGNEHQQLARNAMHALIDTAGPSKARTQDAKPRQDDDAHDDGRRGDAVAAPASPAATGGLDGTKTMNGTPPSSARWSALRQRLRDSAARKGKSSGERAKQRVAGQTSIVTELQTGLLPVLMVKMFMERDEQGHRRIPVLLGHLRFRISDSVNPLHTTSAVFRIELEYGDGLIRWVCYRSLRDFINLHTHYRAAAIKGYLGRSVGAAEGDVGVPSFPKTSLPYFNQLQRQGWGRQGENVKARFAQAQRTALEDYLLEIIKRTILRPEANRLCKFLELSALSVSLAAHGGYQGKQGYLRILSRSSRKDAQRSGLLAPLSWARMHEPKWFIVRESYIVVVEQPDSTDVFDVILIDNAFEIIRPKRLYRQTLHLAQELAQSESKSDAADGPREKVKRTQKGNSEDKATEGGDEVNTAEAGNAQVRLADRSVATAGNDETAILTEGHFRDPQDDEYSGSHRKKSEANVSSHSFYVKNAERRLKLVANNERQMNQFIASMERVARRNIFSKANRFGSFAPIRLNCSARWLVDGRDYFWQVSRAVERAKQRIYIHDWWLSPELYLRRPGAAKYRLDNMLQRKAEQGVKVYVILYNEVSNSFTPTDSNYTKQRLNSLHENIFVQRSPSHFQTGTFYWAHHEKMCVIDETIAFMGGLDLCFGRWDTSAHVLTDNAPPSRSVNGVGNSGHASHPSNAAHDRSAPSAYATTTLGPAAEDGSEFFVWPGQDYANERVMEWHDLTKPEIDLFDRNHYPRMPWHDVGLQLVGQPARDLCRHFTQRWNYLLRIKNHSRHMPFLIPPPDFQPTDLQRFGLTGTCEAQICRSAGPWSMGTANTVEHSIQNAYLKAIQMSEHFVYIENQFFVSSTEVRGTIIENQIGEALVSRIIRAEREGTPWKAVIVIPLIPGFPMPIDHPDASSVRLIVDLQYRSICRGEQSVFGKLRRRGIDPGKYVDFYSLRQWGKLASGRLTTEQVYIHGKAMVVDDRLALIGSANINERSQRGDRDSELACVIRDTDMIDSRMAGKPFKVGRFAHTLRIRLMREHLGVDVDALEDEGQQELQQQKQELQQFDEDHEAAQGLNNEDEDDSYRKQSALLDDQQDESSKHNDKTHVSAAGWTDRWHNSSRQGKGTGLKMTVEDTVSPMGEGVKENVRSTVDRVNGKLEAPRRHVRDHRSEGTEAEQQDDTGKANAVSLDDRATAIGEQVEQGTDTANEDAANVPASGVIVPTVEERMVSENHKSGNEKTKLGHGAQTLSGSTVSLSSSANPNAADIKDNMKARMSNNPWALPVSPPEIDPDMFTDPLDDRFYRDMWMASAVHNTQIFRKVFKSVPDDTVTTWQEYKAFHAWNERLSRSGAHGNDAKDLGAPPPPPPASFSHSARRSNDEGDEKQQQRHDANAPQGATANPSVEHAEAHVDLTPRPVTGGTALQSSQPLPQSLASAGGKSAYTASSSTAKHNNVGGSATLHTDGFSAREMEQMESLLQEMRGTLVLFSTRFLEAEDRSDNFLFPMDKINPLNVYS